MPLTSSQRQTIRGIAMQRDADLNIGRHGITPNVVEEIDRILASQEIAKLKFNTKDAEARGALLADIASALGAEVAGTVGHTAALYRYSDKAEKHILGEASRSEEG